MAKMSELLAFCGWAACSASLGRACRDAGVSLVKTKLEGGDWLWQGKAA